MAALSALTGAPVFQFKFEDLNTDVKKANFWQLLAAATAAGMDYPVLAATSGTAG